MCGFAGILDTARRHGLPPGELAAAMGATLHHRGPDDHGVWSDPEAGVGLAFRRLAIIDLSAAGHQPMVSRSGRFVIIFNGEIYNHAAVRTELEADGVAGPWRGHSDTETLLEAIEHWGIDAALERTVGMFALAAWDRIERRLHLARDRFGEKPLYYGWHDGAFVFGSEPRALRRYPGFDATLDRDALSLYMQFGDVPAPYSIYRHTYKLEPGCVLTLSPDAAAHGPGLAPTAPLRSQGLWLRQYWSLAASAEAAARHPITDEREAIDRLEATLADAIALQSIADVPLGAFLSGGIDSTAVVALMQAHAGRPVKTFTIGVDVAGFDEAHHAKAVAHHLGTEHTELYITPQQMLDVIPALPQIYSEPFADSSQIPTHLVAQMARRHVTVALSGDGGDEMLGGYTRYLWIPRLWSALRHLPPGLRRPLTRAVEGIPIGAWDWANRLLPGRRIARLGDKAHKAAARLRDVTTIDDLYRMIVTAWPHDSGVVPGAHRLATVLDRGDRLPCLPDPEHRMMLLDALTYLPDDILHKVDRAAMAVSLETRAPFLDHRVAELAWRLPVSAKIRGGETKWILRQVLDRHVPRALMERPKMGFSVPIDRWLGGPLRDWAEELLDESRLRADGYFAPDPIRRQWSEHLSGRRNRSHELWCVLMFQAWLQAAR